MSSTTPSGRVMELMLAVTWATACMGTASMSTGQQRLLAGGG